MKKTRLPLILSCVGVFCLTGCGKTNVFEYDVEFQSIPTIINHKKDFISINENNFYLKADETKQITYLSLPTSFTDQMTYKSTNESVVSVGSDGLVTAKAKGFAQVLVESLDKSYSDKINVFVGESVDKSTATDIVNNLISEGVTFDKKIKSTEIVCQEMRKAGATYNKAFFNEYLVYSEEDAFFEVYSDDLTIKTANGTPEITGGKWTFFVDKSYVTYLTHETPYGKKYLEAKTQAYLGRPKYQIIYDILDMFFVDGKDIVTDMLDEAAGKDELDPTSGGCILDYYEKSYSNVSLKSLTTDGTDLAPTFDITFTDSTLTAREEFSIEIPAGTKYDAIDSTTYIFKDKHVKGWSYFSDISFELDEEPYDRIFSKDVTYERNFEIEIPDIQNGGYQKVDSLYDL